jgi:hypothetical protein
MLGYRHWSGLCVVVFDENNLPLSHLHPNAKPQLRTDILLLPPTLCNSHENVLVDHPRANGANPGSEFTGV